MNESEAGTQTHRAPPVRVLTASSCATAVSTKPPARRAGVTPTESGRRGWASVGAVALGAFVVVMTETMPVGLLPQIAEGLNVSLGLAGLMVLVPGASAAVSAPLFFLGSGRFNRRPVILTLGLTVLVSNVAVAAAPNFALVLVARMLLGATIGAFWTVVSPVGPKLVGPASGTRAITIIAAGISGGTVVGLPAGQFLGDLIGWRLTFATAAAATLIVVITQTILLPSIPPDGGTHMRDLINTVSRRAVQFGMIAGAVVFVGQFTAWTYITPFLMDHTHLSSGTITLLFVIYGCGGIVGSLTAGSLFKRGVIASFAGSAAVVGALVIVLAITGKSAWAAVPLLTLWGLVWGIVNPATLVWLLDAAPENQEAVSAVNVTNLQVALVVGSAVGAILVSTSSLPTVFLTAGFIILASALLAGVASRFVTLRRRI
ncbi:MFS transporter [Streptomyces sp. NPDC101209]|uniref:MFS transporter n=1 Tax=Streptomyces sp. NPDC101209 TaxID=3366129 RepID=UPI00382ABB53